ncbi:MAG: hypothetical protein ACAI35_02745 [Candidatus Methylacidiphilales bacterium]
MPQCTNRTLRALYAALFLLAVTPSICVFTSGGTPSVAKADDDDDLTREKLPDTVKLMIKDLSVDAPDYKKFLQDYAYEFDKTPPEIVEKAVEFFKGSMGPLTLKILKGIDGKEPIKVSDTEAKYDVKDIAKDSGVPDSMDFFKKDGKWYLK